jgi:hypothetical protein
VCEEGLQALLTRVDARQPVFAGDDVIEWPEGHLEQLMAVGLLRETANAQSIVCDACAEGHVEEVQLFESPPGSGFRAYIVCPENGRVLVPPARRRQWEVDLSRLARALADALPAAAGVEELAPGRVWFLGRTALGGQSRDAFLVRGGTWPDFRTVLAGARRFQESPRPVVLVADIVPSQEVWSRDDLTVLTVRSLSQFEDSCLALDRDQMNRVLGHGRRQAAPIDIVTVPTPQGAQWQYLSIVMDDFEFVSSVFGKRDKRTFQQTGFRNRVKGEYPDRLWGLLREFALGGGELTEESLDTKTRNNLKQYVSELRDRLQMVFAGIEGDPIVKPSAGRYRTGFAITAKDGITLGFPVGISWSGMSVAETHDGNIRFTADVPQRFRVYRDGQAENRGGEMGEGLGPRTKEHNLQTLRLLGKDGRPNRAGQALLDTLRGDGRVKRDEYDKGMEDLCGILCQLTGIESEAFTFRGDRGEWDALFEASSERLSR